MAPEAPEAEKQTTLFHTGRGYGPLQTSAGILYPGQSLPVPESLAKKLTSVYRHIRLAADVIPGMKENAEAKAENEKLKAQIKELEGKLSGGSDAAAQARIADLEARLKEFLDAGSKKDLDALKEKHADAVPAA